MCLRTLHMASFDLLIDPMLLLSPAVHILSLRKMQACKLKMWRKHGIAGQRQSVTNASGKGAANRHLFSTTILSPFIAAGLLTTKICSALSLQGSGPLFALFYIHIHFCVSATLVCVVYTRVCMQIESQVIIPSTLLHFSVNYFSEMGSLVESRARQTASKPYRSGLHLPQH